ncbi:uncharacterized protein LOC127898872 [Citrus sinensis]|uniref:uncharacterized protein LOC112097962 n=1 Tax=Citrus clementina TaxID=85681 RepID=UPI000CECEA03|nr:uncharacterized protein LOC112097962 [Citrus x clementina]XP_052287330.1 uncharacterized protein LOC127898872 [Citrus sinensis]
MDGDQIRRIENQINGMLMDEEIYWRQRSRAEWLKEGDRNTKYFHSKASARRRKNKIWGIENSHSQIQDALDGISPKVTTSMNHQLEEPFTEEEIVEALHQMSPTKAPGPDGLPAVFFQKHWQTVRSSMIGTCMHILNEGGNLTALNHTFIALIPKTAKPKKVTEFRPISLCNVIYRIIAKTIANRLKPILLQIISPTQSAFIPNRLISDNVIIGYECLHKIRHSQGKKKGLVALKLDISKAYDRVEWSFLKQTMKKLGFSRKWLELIMGCITSVSFSAEKKKRISGLRFAEDVTISHLLFADDSLVFSAASVTECKHLKGIFDRYAKALGQIFNFDKSSMFFGGNIPEEQKAAIRNIFNLKVVSKYEKYLGLPSMKRRKKTSFFREVKLKVLSKINNWQHKMFSSGGKEILIKAVAQAVPAFAMSVFKLPKGLCEEIQSEIAKFWWGSKKDKRGIHWARWDKLSCAKSRGGLGFRDFISFNQAMVAKQGWRLIQFPNSLVSKVLRARYFRSCSFLNAKPGSNPSFIWRSILWGRQVIQKGARWHIGNGSNILNVAKLNQHFMQEDTEAIIKIPLPRSQKVDEMLWHYDKHGEYSVRSGYQIALKLKAPDEPGSSGSNSKRWKVVWFVELPEKMKIFMWRAARNLLPTAENLWKRKCLKDPICQGCNREVETNHDILEFIYEVWSTWGKTEAEQAIAFCWAVWFARNKRIFERKKLNPRALAAKAESLLEAYHRARKPDASHIHNVKRIVQKKWEPPPRNFLKVNVDAVAKELSLSALIMEADCKEVVDLLNNTKGSRTGISWVISDIQEKRRDFKEVKFRHIPRTCNTCAHSLAKLAIVANTSAVWLDHIPAEILNVLNSVV